MSGFSLEDLEAIVAARASSGAPDSYTARLVADGISRSARKLGEEAVETVIAAISESDDALAAESADLLYHLLVVLRLRGVPLSAVLDELGRRTARTGIEEKRSRPRGGD